MPTPKIITYFILSVLICACTNKETIRVGATTTLEDSGLLTELITAFEKQHDIQIKPIIAGSGQIHALIKNNDIDSAITHDPKGEETLLKAGLINQRIPLMYNDFIIVGPNNDPAHIKLSLTPDEALEKIVNSGLIFVSRDDQSGTHQMEKHWWSKISTVPPTELYVKTGTGMGATLTVAAEKNAYTLTDRGTWLNFSNKQSIKVLFEDAEYLPNQYSVLSFSENKASAWENWITSDQTKQFITNYRIDNKPVFFDAPMNQ
ncbi:MAG: substrate-binding domain-containing protein [Cellvibrionaceae bacterium]